MRERQVIYAMLIQHKLPGRPEGDDRSGSVAWRVITYCWNFDPAQRPTCEQVDGYFTSLLESEGELSRVSTQNSDKAGKPRRLQFWEDLKMKSGLAIDVSRIYSLLLTVVLNYGPAYS